MAIVIQKGNEVKHFNCGLRIADCGLRIADCVVRIAECGMGIAEFKGRREKGEFRSKDVSPTEEPKR
jgi:hypothetical protein